MPAVAPADGVLRPETPVAEAFPDLATVQFAAAPSRGVERPPSDLDFDDDGFGDFAGTERLGQARVLAGPLAPPGQSSKRSVRYGLLTGAALLLALLALVPLLLLRSDPEEMTSTPKVPAAGGPQGGDVQVELAAPTDLTDKVELTWRATRELDFAVVIAAEGEKARVLLAERNHTMTVDVEPGRKYCFLVQASDGDQVYESDPVPLRGASCRK